MSVFRRTSLAAAAPPTTSAPLSANGSGNVSPPPPSGQAGTRRLTRTGSLHVGLVVAALALVLLVIFLAQNARSVDVSFLGGHLRVSLAVAMLIASLVGALIMGAAGTARIGQLRRSARRDSRTK